LNHEGLAGFVAAVDYVAALGEPFVADAGTSRRQAIVSAFDAIANHESTLAARFLEGAAAVRGFRLFGIADPARLAERTPTFALRLGDTPPRQVAHALADRGYGDEAIRHRLLTEGLDEGLVGEALAELPGEPERAAPLIARRGAGPRTARYLAGRGFGEEALEAALGAAFGQEG